MFNDDKKRIPVPTKVFLLATEGETRSDQMRSDRLHHILDNLIKQDKTRQHLNVMLCIFPKAR